MATVLLFCGVRRISFLLEASVSVRLISSRTSALEIGVGTCAATGKAEPRKSDLRNQIFGAKFRRRSVSTVLQNWVRKGRRLPIREIRRILMKLSRLERHKDALEMLMWTETRNSLRMSPEDRVFRLDLTIRLHGLLEAEEYFFSLPDSASQKAACLPLLHGYVKERNTERAEALMVKLRDMGLLLNPNLYNEMMKLYMGTSQCKKVPLVIRQMKLNNIPRDGLSYNLWIKACTEVSGVDSVEMAYREMLRDKNVQVGWSTLCTLADAYIKAGLVKKAFWALKIAEKTLSTDKRLGYFFLITLYTSLDCKEGVLRVWEASKMVGHRITCANYMCILLCLVKLGDIEKAEEIFVEWESNCGNYDIRVSNVLLGAYVRNGCMRKAESLHLRTLKRGASPNSKTWEILMEGWVKCAIDEKAMNHWKICIALLENSVGKPQEDL